MLSIVLVSQRLKKKFVANDSVLRMACISQPYIHLTPFKHAPTKRNSNRYIKKKENSCHAR